ncbi:hypothetical protein D3C87_431370 [compost metagenome]
MKQALLFIFACVSLSGFSQSNWIKDHAVWHYKYFNHSMLGSGYIKVWDAGDTTIQNKVCTKLDAEQHYFMPTGPEWNLMEIVTDYVSGIVYFSNDTVYHWDQDHFSVLYDFSAQANDQWLLQTGGSPGFSCNDTSVCIVQSVGTVIIGGQNYRELTVGYAPDAGFHIRGRVNTRFGASQGYVLPFNRSCDSITSIDLDQITFICYEDDSLYYNPTGESCEYYLGLNEFEKNRITVFPNPSAGKIELLSEVPLKNIKVMNLLGATLKEVNTNLTLTEIDLSELPKGTYYLDIENSNGERSVKPIQLSGK